MLRMPISSTWRAGRIMNPSPRGYGRPTSCGGGGLSLGFAEAARRIGRGIKIAAAVDRFDAADAEPNFPGATVTRQDVAAIFDGAAGGRPPSARRNGRPRSVRSISCSRVHPVRAIRTSTTTPAETTTVTGSTCELPGRPKSSALWLPIENVPAVHHDIAGRCRPRARPSKAGYRVATAVLDLTELGVPQRRRRHLLLALRDQRIDPTPYSGPPSPVATTSPEAWHGRSATSWGRFADRPERAEHCKRREQKRMHWLSPTQV